MSMQDLHGMMANLILCFSHLLDLLMVNHALRILRLPSSYMKMRVMMEMLGLSDIAQIRNAPVLLLLVMRIRRFAAVRLLAV